MIKNQQVRICKEVAQGMQFLHANHVIHRDLKPANVKTPYTKLLYVKVLVSSLSKDVPSHVKLSDFGSARLVGEKEKARYTVAVGTPTCVLKVVFPFLLVFCFSYCSRNS